MNASDTLGGKIAIAVVLLGCGTTAACQVDEADLVGSYRISPMSCEYGTLTIAADNAITFNGRPATQVAIDGFRTDATGTPNVTFIIDYILGGEGGHVHEMWQLWMDHDGGSGTENACAITITR